MKHIAAWGACSATVALCTPVNNHEWHEVSSPVEGITKLNDVFFYGPQYGWISGDDGVLLFTGDSGKIWTESKSPALALLSLKALYFTDALVGWTVGVKDSSVPSEILLKTTDGGKNWIIRKAWNDTLFRDIYFLNDADMISMRDSITGSRDSGATWISQQYLCGQCVFSDLYSISSDTLYASGWEKSINTGKLLYSSNRGLNWFDKLNESFLPAKGTQFKSIAFSAPSVLWVVGNRILGENGLILKSTDSGKKWEIDSVPQALERVRFIDRRIGYIFGRNILLLTSDGGAHWDKQPVSQYAVNGVFMPNPMHCWAVGDKGVILHGFNKDVKYIKVLSPKTGDGFNRKDSIPIVWESNGISKVNIKLSADNGNNFFGRFNIENTGRGQAIFGSRADTSDKCIAGIFESADETVFGLSGTFTVKPSSIESNNYIGKARPFLRIMGSNIHFDLVKTSKVSIAVQSLNGSTVFYRNIPLCAPGSHRETLPTTAFPNGCYLVSTIIGDRTYTQTNIVCR